MNYWNLYYLTYIYHFLIIFKNEKKLLGSSNTADGAGYV